MLALRRRVTGAIAVLAVGLCPRGAAADGPSKDQCFDAYEQAQRLRKEYKLRAAHEQLVTCGADSCPAFVRQDCAKWLGEVEASTPTIVVLARRADGTAIEGARATLDGGPFADALDGRAVAVDPGPHDLRCEAEGAAVQTRIVVAEGAKNQQFLVSFGAAPVPAPVEKPPPRPARGGIPTATWVLGGVAVAGAISFTAFAVAGRQVQSCAPTCTRGQVDDLRRDYLIADVSWITGLVAAGAALYFALTAPASTPPATAIRW
jgi:hypothetical protein